MKDDKKDDKASKRLNQLSSHLSTKLPPDYSDVLSTITTLKEIAATPNPSRRGYARQKQAGKLWVRERITQLLDANTFEEIGSVSGTVTWKPTGPTTEVPESFTPSNNVQGFGKLKGRRVLLTADDFSIRSGHADGSTADKTIYAEKLAIALKLPVIKLVDGSSGGGSVTTIRKEGWSYLPYVRMYAQVVEQLNKGIPNLGAVVGPAVLPLPYTVCFGFGLMVMVDRPRRGPCRLMPFLRHGGGYRRAVQRRPGGRRQRHLRGRAGLSGPGRAHGALHQRDD
jgi:acetyl-CoA carboxylase carboxyltransferase component